MQIGWKDAMELDLDQEKNLLNSLIKNDPNHRNVGLLEVRDAKARGSKVTFSPVIGIIWIN
jgi:hypothetical protein